MMPMIWGARCAPHGSRSN